MTSILRQLAKKLRTLATLSPLTLRTFLFCLILIPICGIWMKWFGYKGLVSRQLKLTPVSRRSTSRRELETTLNQVNQGFLLALKYSPYQGSCLSRAILMKGLLQKQQVAARLRIGVNCTFDALLAHAWLESDIGLVKVGRQESRNFVPFSKSIEVSANVPQKVG